MREMKGLSQEKLARLADVANNTIVKIEAGKNQNPTLDTLNKIAKALEGTIYYLTNNKKSRSPILCTLFENARTFFEKN